MADPLRDSAILLGVTGSIACYKAVDLASKLVQAGAIVDVVMTQAAQQFVTPLCFASITHRPVVDDLWTSHGEAALGHVELAKRAAAVVVAPATANTMAKMALGLVDDALVATLLDTRAPVLLAPAMEQEMYTAPATQANVATLRARGVSFIEPGAGRLASGLTGQGRLADPEQILGALRQLMGRGGDLGGRRIVVSAGGTREPLDPVRYISNRSSGKMGYALAEAARDRGADVTLVSAATALPPPYGVTVVPVATASEMRSALDSATVNAHALLMAAAVSDYRPEAPAAQKIKKEPGSTRLSIALTRNPDILAETRGSFLKVGFAAETDNLLAHAREKLIRKGVDLLVANDVSEEGSGFGSDTNRVHLLGTDGRVESLPVLPKREVADLILDRVVALLAQR